MKIIDKIKAADDIKKEKIFVSEWDVEIELKGMTGSQRARMFDVCLDDKGNFDRGKSFPFTVIACSSDPQTGEKIFNENDIDWLLEKSASSLEKIALPAMKLSGLTPDEEQEIEKNLNSVCPKDDSVST